jgi:UPF0716 protein FxsA
LIAITKTVIIDTGESNMTIEFKKGFYSHMQKKRNIFGYLLLLFTLIPFIELFLLLQIAERTSATFTFILIILTGIVGAYFAKVQGRLVIFNIRQALNQGIMPKEELVNGLCVLIGGAFLLTPGILTDIAGFTLLIPYTRNFYKKIVKNKFEKMIRGGGY